MWYLCPSSNTLGKPVCFGDPVCHCVSDINNPISELGMPSRAPGHRLVISRESDGQGYPTVGCYSNTIPSKKEPKTHERLDKERGVPVTQHQPLRLEGPLYCLLYGEQPPGSPKVTHLLSFTLILFLPILFPQLRWNA